MDPLGKRALTEVELAEAELAVLKQGHLLRELLNTQEPTEDAAAQLKRLREVVSHLSNAGRVSCDDFAELLS